MRTLVLLALATVAAIGAGTPARSASLPAASVAGKGGAPIPKLDWRDCDDGFQCATAKVPLDYDSPRGKTIGLALIRAGFRTESEDRLALRPSRRLRRSLDQRGSLPRQGVIL